MNLNPETFPLEIFLYVAGGQKKGRVVFGPMDSTRIFDHELVMILCLSAHAFIDEFI